MPHSKTKLWMILIPKIGRELINTGSKAQCMAQATDVAIPNASQLIFIFILKKGKDSIFAITLQVLKNQMILKRRFLTMGLDVAL